METAHLRDNNWERVKVCHSQRKQSFEFYFLQESSEESILKDNPQNNFRISKEKLVYQKKLKTSFLEEILNRSEWRMWLFK